MPANIPPPATTSPDTAFLRLLTVLDTLRTECPWDKKQTMETLRHLTIEETYELGDAILDNDLQEIKKMIVQYLSKKIPFSLVFLQHLT